MFQRLYGRDTYKGTGIGLAIAKRIVENHDGCITATGELNKGATFDIYIPTIKNRSMDSSLLHVVLADDDESDRTNFTEALEESRIRTVVHAVKDGVELMEFLTRKIHQCHTSCFLTSICP